jgi:quercetin dioxygenase-like cupin family protein
MDNFIKESEAEAEVIGEPFKRTIRHLVAPWTHVKSEHVWVGTTAVEPGFTSNEHKHDTQEEIFYCLEGRGDLRVNGEDIPMLPGDTLLVKPGNLHMVVNRGEKVFKLLAVVCPYFVKEKFKKDHKLA